MRSTCSSLEILHISERLELRAAHDIHVESEAAPGAQLEGEVRILHVPPGGHGQGDVAY